MALNRPITIVEGFKSAVTFLPAAGQVMSPLYSKNEGSVHITTPDFSTIVLITEELMQEYT